MPRLEKDFQARLVKRIKDETLPGSFILKNDTGYLQGIPDLTVFYGDRWAMLEVKKSPDEDYEPNQEWYLERLGEMAFTATIFPENEEEVLRELQHALRPRRIARLPQR